MLYVQNMCNCWNILFLFLIVGADSYMFRLAEDYAHKFQTSIEHFKELSRKFEHEEDNLDREAFKTFEDEEEYDFIIVGGGTSGSVLANRLSEVPEWKVLLLEAGAEESEVTKIPAMQPYLHTTPYNWGFKSTPQTSSCLGMEENICSIPMGKALGGSSAINDMIFTRGNPKDYDQWADNGLLGWCWDSVLPYFKKMEDIHIKNVDKKYHHLGGPIHLENFQFNLDDLAEYVIEAGSKLGIKKVDYNGKEQVGFGYPQVITKNGKRFSMADAYINPVRHRKNLIIKPLSYVSQILISRHTKEATGVEYVQHEDIFLAKANKEVILAAGAVNTPKLLTLSGIGTKEDLDKHDIEPVVYLTVGNNLKDHIQFIGLNFLYNETIPDDEDNYLAVLDYLKHGRGPLTSADLELIGFVKSDPSKKFLIHPNIEFLLSNNDFKKQSGILRTSRIKNEIYKAIWEPLEELQGFTMNVILTHAKSKGVVRLIDTDPLHNPKIDLNSLSDEEEHDIETLLDGIKLALSLLESETMQELGIYLNPNELEECKHFLFKSDDYWKCALRYLSISMGHLTGTAKMGVERDKESVVDDKLKVYGVNRLRVADASVIPVDISGHIMGPTAMIGEKAADLIKEEWL